MSAHIAGRDHCLSLVRAVDRPTGAARYGRMFPELKPLITDPHELRRAGEPGGVCAVGGPSGDDAAGAAGWPFLGQLIAHDITADRSRSAAAPPPNACATPGPRCSTWRCSTRTARSARRSCSTPRTRRSS